MNESDYLKGDDKQETKKHFVQPNIYGNSVKTFRRAKELTAKLMLVFVIFV